jgi:hypothetical protein
MTGAKRKAKRRDVLAAVRAAAGSTGWKVCRRCGELAIPPGLGVCIGCVRFTVVIPGARQ